MEQSGSIERSDIAQTTNSAEDRAERRKEPRIDGIITKIQDATEAVLRKSRTK